MMTFPTEWKNKTCSKPPTSHPFSLAFSSRMGNQSHIDGLRSTFCLAQNALHVWQKFAWRLLTVLASIDRWIAEETKFHHQTGDSLNRLIWNCGPRMRCDFPANVTCANDMCITVIFSRTKKTPDCSSACPKIDRFRAAIVTESLHEAILLQVCLLVKQQVQDASEHQATST